jgi:hypothetical protein
MTSKARHASIDLTRDLPARARKLSADAMSQIFGGCIALFQPCPYNGACCSYVCGQFLWISSERRWTYACVPNN